MTGSLQSLDSHVDLLRRMADGAQARGEIDTASRWEERALLAGERVARVRDLLAALARAEAKN